MIQDTARMQEKLQEKIDGYSDMLFKIAYVRTGNRADAEDIVQETFYQYLRTSKVFDSEEYERAWLIRVTINGCRKMWRSGFYRRRSDVPAPESGTAIDFGEAEEQGPEEHFLDKERARTVLEAVRELPAAYRDVIHLFYYEGYSTKQIAKLLQKKEATVRSDLHRGRDKLKAVLKEAHDFEETVR